MEDAGTGGDRLVFCPDCDGAGEIWECRANGRPCPHTNDIWHRCLRCKGNGEIASGDVA